MTLLTMERCKPVHFRRGRKTQKFYLMENKINKITVLMFQLPWFQIAKQIVC